MALEDEVLPLGALAPVSARGEDAAGVKPDAEDQGEDGGEVQS